MINAFKANSDYNNSVNQYKKSDGILALILFGVFILLYSLLAILQVNFKFIKENITAAGCIFNIIIIAVTIAMIKIKKQKLESVGLTKGNWKLSCILGVILAAFYFFNNCLSHLLNGSNLISASKIAVLAIYYILVALCEEIAFRGFIGTRINGIIKNKWLAIIVVGLLFIVMHFPYRMIAYGMTINQLTINNLSWIIDLMVTHIILNFIYLKTNSLYGSIIPHFMSNFAYNIISR